MSRQSARRPRVLVLGTGGTIAGSAAATDSRAYLAGVLGVADLIDIVPGLAGRVDLLTEQVFSVDSVDLTLADRLTLARRVVAALRGAAEGGQPVDGVVITHGTDTLEDTGFVLHQVLGDAALADVPLVLTGAMRPADAPGADGPANLADAITVAAHPGTRGWGVLAVFGGLVFAGRDVIKRSAGGINPFEAAWGPLGEIAGTQLHLFARSSRRSGEFTAVLQDESPLPRVDVLHLYPELAPSILRALVSDLPAGLVLLGPGNGNVPAALVDDLAHLRSRGTVIVRTSSTGAGVVFRDGAINDTSAGNIAAGDLTPGQARALLALALHRTRDPEAIQRLFDVV